MATDPHITQRRAEVARLRREGHTPQQIAELLKVSVNVVRADIKLLRRQGVDLGSDLDPDVVGQVVRFLQDPKQDQIYVNERRAKVLEMRLQGYSVAQIAQTLGISPTLAAAHLANALDASVVENTTQLRQMELERLDRMLTVLENGISVGDPKAVTAAIRVSERRARLLGLDKPIQVEATVVTVDLIDREIERLSAKLAAAPEVFEGEVIDEHVVQ